MRDSPFVFVTGGCRSGKSAYAQRLAEGYSQKRLYIATAWVCGTPSARRADAKELCEGADAEMAARILSHQQARGAGWRTYETFAGPFHAGYAPADAAAALHSLLAGVAEPGEAVLFDCLSLWAAAFLEGERKPECFAGQCDLLLDALWALPCPVVIVNSEVGMGLVPPSAEARAFRDMAGTAAQKAAARSLQAVFVSCGLPLALKGSLPVE